MNQEQLLLEEARNKIISLKAVLQAVEPKAHAYDLLCKVVDRILPSGCYGVNVNHIEDRIEKYLIAKKEKLSQLKESPFTPVNDGYPTDVDFDDTLPTE